MGRILLTRGLKRVLTAMGEIIYVVSKSYFYRNFILSLVFYVRDILCFTLVDGHG